MSPTLSTWIRRSTLAALALLVAACATGPTDPATGLLESGERIGARMAATLMHGHDMTEPPYDAPEGYRPIPAYTGELLLTDQRMLFVELPAGTSPSYLSIPYPAIARARPSRTTLLHYVVVWDTGGHPDSFVVHANDVHVLHQQVGAALIRRIRGQTAPTQHAIAN